MKKTKKILETEKLWLLRQPQECKVVIAVVSGLTSSFTGPKLGFVRCDLVLVFSRKPVGPDANVFICTEEWNLWTEQMPELTQSFSIIRVKYTRRLFKWGQERWFSG